MPKRSVFQAGALLLAASLVAFSASAARVEGLYGAAVSVSGQGAGAQAANLNRALARVLVKVSGSRAVLQPGPDEEALAAALRNAQSLVQQFDYQTHEDKTWLHAAFDKQSIDHLLAENGRAVWGSERPATLVWLAVDQAGQRFLLPSGSVGATATVLRQVAASRGIPLTLPIVDITDRQSVSYSDVAGGFTDRVMQASSRYGNRSVLMGHLTQLSPGQWDASWTHILSGTEQSWSARGQSLADAIRRGIDGSADVLAERYAARAGIRERLSVQIRGMNGIADYARVQNYLQGLNVVTDVQLVLLEGSNARFELEVQGDARSLQDAISLQSVLQSAAANPAESGLVFDILP